MSDPVDPKVSEDLWRRRGGREAAPFRAWALDACWSFPSSAARTRAWQHSTPCARWGGVQDIRCRKVRQPRT